ncbi:MAG: cobalamin-binding protein [Betaproteobacteria bacterium HGW-Betaproteobacteria-1]|jgi:iron complex transport system substrate-binding protein|nr:MAG: cobalamin-binding protein [Betaproteobacteria bacterium HGW-Betaproteobacteria-1]
MRYPQRIVCLTTEPTEVLYLLGEQHRIAGISGFTTRPAIARKEKPKVAAFTSANIDKILALNPDLVLGFSNLQADIAAELVRAGVEVHIFNQRSISQMLNMIITVGSLVGAADKAAALVSELETKIERSRDIASEFAARPIIYFEEWNDPLISGIRWVSELIEIAGGSDCFAELAQHKDAKNRVIADPDEVARRNPDIIIGSWCGKKFRPEQLMQRPGWKSIKAVQSGFVQEIKSADILQPGPSLITEGLPQLQAIIQRWSVAQSFRKHWD